MDWYLAVLKKYADFSGRATRTEYWMFVLFNVIVAIGLYVVSIVIGGVVSGKGENGLALGSAVVSLYSLAVLLPSLGVTVRRLHDTGRSGWWWLINFVPFGGIVLLVFMVLDSQPGDNQYGPNPKAPGYPSQSPAPQAGI